MVFSEESSSRILLMAELHISFESISKLILTAENQLIVVNEGCLAAVARFLLRGSLVAQEYAAGLLLNLATNRSSENLFPFASRPYMKTLAKGFPSVPRKGNIGNKAHTTTYGNSRVVCYQKYSVGFRGCT